MKLLQSYIYPFLAVVALVFLTGYSGVGGGCIGPIPLVGVSPSSCAVECIAIHMDETALNACEAPLQACADSCALEADSQGENHQEIFESCYSANCQQTYQDCVSVTAEATFQCMLGADPYLCPTGEYALTSGTNITLMTTLALDSHSQAFNSIDPGLSQETTNAIDFSLLGINLDLLNDLTYRFRIMYENILY